jgi:hypothetical protein
MTWILHIIKLHIDISPKVWAENYSVFGGLLIRHNFSSAKGEAASFFVFLFFHYLFVTWLVVVDNKENIEKKKI